MLKTYSRYCRLFLYDYSMIHDYYDDLVKAQIRCKVEFWIDYICLYKMQKSFDETVEKMLKILVEFYGISENWSFKSYFFDDKLKEFAEVIKDKERVVPIFETLETNESSQQSLQHMKDGKLLTPSIPKVLTPAIHQQYSFKSPLMRYLLDHASTQLLQKLQMSCKDLYLQNPFVYCQNLCIKKELKTNSRNVTKTVFFENALIMSSNNLQHFDFKYCHLVNSLEIVGLPPCTLPYFGKCSLKYLTLENQSISENEVQYLASKLQFLKFVKVAVTKSDGTIAPVEYVVEKLSHIPNIMLIDPLKTSYTETTDQNLAALKFDQKFKSFYLNQLPEDFNIQNLCEFIKANAAEDAELKFNYDSTIDFFLKFELGQRLRNEIQMISNNFNVAII